MDFSQNHGEFIKNVMKTTYVNKLLLAIFERSYYDLYIYITFCGYSMSLSKVMTRGVILNSPPKKET